MIYGCMLLGNEYFIVNKDLVRLILFVLVLVNRFLVSKNPSAIYEYQGVHHVINIPLSTMQG